MKPHPGELGSWSQTMVKALAIAMALLLPAVVQGQFTFTTNNGSITITGYTGSGGVVVIPSSTNGYTVTGIGEFAFEDCSNVTSIVIPNSVTNIGEGPFLGCSSLTNISVNVGSPSFATLNDVLFDSTKDTLIAYPGGLPATNNGAYTIPGSVTNIGQYAFGSCLRLTGISIPASISTIGDYAFVSCSNLTSVTLPNVSTIGEFAFTECTGLTSVTIDNSVTDIGVAAFTFCTSLTGVAIAGTVTNVGGLAFAFCTNLTCAYFGGNAPPDVGTAFYDDPDAVVYYVPGTTAWGTTFGGAPTVEETPASDFEVYGNSITIDQYTGLGGAVVIPPFINGYPVTSLGNGPLNNGVFQNTKVTSVTIPITVTNIAQSTFSDCTSLTNITIQGGVIGIGEYVFSGCTNLINISVTAANSAYSSTNGILFDKAYHTLVQYPEGLTDITYTIPYGVTSVGLAAFYDCTSLTSITIPNSVTNIGQEAFDDCTGLTSVTIPSSITSIEAYAFAYCTSLTGITVNGVTSIDNEAFFYCTGLTTVTITKGVLSIGQAVFASCTSLTNVTIPDSITSIGIGAFQDCTRLPSVSLPASVTSVGVNTFVDCTSLTSIFVDAANPAYSSLNGVLFDKAQDTLIDYPAGLTGGSYTIPNSVTNISYNSLSYCTGLTNIVIPSSANSIAAIAFQNCTNLTSAYFEGNAPPDLGDAFQGDPATVYYLPGTTGWGATFGGAPTELWLPSVSSFAPFSGLQNHPFGFLISWAPTNTIIVQACTNLTNPVWVSVATNALSNGTNYFSDAQWTNYPCRFYRVSGP